MLDDILNKYRKSGSSRQQVGGVTPPSSPAPLKSSSVFDSGVSAPVRVETPAAPPVATPGLFGLTYDYVKEPTHAFEIIASLQGRTCGLDIETAKLPVIKDHPLAGLNPHLSKPRLLQLCAGPTECYVIDLFFTGLDCIENLPGIDLTAHNAVFEMQHLMHAGINLPDVQCSMLLDNALNNRVFSSLADLVLEHCQVQLPKECQKSDWGAAELSTQQLNYAAMDAFFAFRLSQKMLKMVHENGRQRVYSLLHHAQWPVVKMIHKGFLLDSQAVRICGERVRSELRALKGRVLDLMDGVDNLNSPPQIQAWLKRNLDEKTLEEWPKTDGGALSTDKYSLERADHPAIMDLLAYRKLDHFNSSFLESLSNLTLPKTGRLHPEFKIAGAITGRMSCEKPNLQSIPRGLESRRMFVPSPNGYSLVVADYSQMETRLAAMVSRDEKMLKCYTDGDDLHILTAATLTGKAPEDVTKGERNAAKAANFGLIYGQGVKSFRIKSRNSYHVNFSEAKATKIRTTFLEHYQTLHKWQQNQRIIAQSRRVIDSVSGRQWRIPYAKIYTVPLNYPIQGAGAEILYAALARLDKYLDGLDACLVNVVHDELIVEAADNDAPAAKAALERAMTEGFLEVFPEASTRDLVEAKIGKSWAEAK